MSQKRQQQEEEDCSSEDKRRKIPSLRSVVAEVITLRKMQTFMEPVLEPLIRRVVREEVDLALKKYVISMRRSCGKDIYSSESRNLRLRFSNAISLPVFTGTRMEGEDGISLQVTLIDTLTGEVVSGDSHCSTKVEIVVLEGDFDSDEGDNWTAEEFKNNIVKERKGKKPLLNGEAFLTLKEGTCLVGDISFTDNSSWTRSRKFRLGARVVDNTDRVRIREAKTESFVVRDHRGELYKKHHPPFLSDEVWRLEKIGKGGAFHRRLCKERVLSMQDFLTLLFLDPARLRNILGPGMSAKMWEVIVEHARTCVLDKKLYVYYPSEYQQKKGVTFTIVGEVMGVFSDGQFVSSEKLSETEKADAREMVISAFKHWSDVVIIDDGASCTDVSSSLSTADDSSNTCMLSNSDNSKLLTSHKNKICDYPEPSPSSPDIIPSIYPLGTITSLDDYNLQSMDSLDIRFDQPLGISGQVSNIIICDTDSMTQAFCDDEHLGFFDSDCPLPSSTLGSANDLQTAVNSFLVRSVPLDKAQTRWKMLFSVLRWFSIRRIVTRKYKEIKACC